MILNNGSFSIVKSYKTQLQSILQFASFEQMLHLIGGKK